MKLSNLPFRLRSRECIRARVKNTTAAMVAASCLVAWSSAHGAVDDWMCLTERMRGNEQARLDFIAAASYAASHFGIAPAAFVALKQTESGNGLNPLVINRNNNGTVDRGYFQINVDTWLPELQRIGAPTNEAEIHDVSTNALVAAWVLRRELRGRTFLEGVGRYHKGGGNDARAKRIRATYVNRFRENLERLVRQCPPSPKLTSSTP